MESSTVRQATILGHRALHFYNACCERFLRECYSNYVSKLVFNEWIDSIKIAPLRPISDAQHFRIPLRSPSTSQSSCALCSMHNLILCFTASSMESSQRNRKHLINKSLPFARCLCIIISNIVRVNVRDTVAETRTHDLLLFIQEASRGSVSFINGGCKVSRTPRFIIDTWKLRFLQSDAKVEEIATVSSTERLTVPYYSLVAWPWNVKYNVSSWLRLHLFLSDVGLNCHS